MDKTFDPADASATRRRVAGWELQNMLTVCSLIADGRVHAHRDPRRHYRLDYPARDDAHWRLHLLWRRPMETPIPEPID